MLYNVNSVKFDSSFIISLGECVATNPPSIVEFISTMTSTCVSPQMRGKHMVMLPRDATFSWRFTCQKYPSYRGNWLKYIEFHGTARLSLQYTRPWRCTLRIRTNGSVLNVQCPLWNNRVETPLNLGPSCFFNFITVSVCSPRKTIRLSSTMFLLCLIGTTINGY